MKTIHLFLMILISGITLIGNDSCSKSDNEPATDDYVSNLSAAPGWTNVADAADLMFFFNTPAAGVATGTFDGNRNGTTDPGGFSGSVDHSSIQLTFTSGNNDGRTFSGSIDHSSSSVTYINITSPASGANAAITLKFKR